MIATYSTQWPGYTVVSLPVYYAPTPVAEPPDDLNNPKIWAIWFQEFLEELYGRFETYLPIEPFRRARLVTPRGRSWLMFREWKMKSWKQRLYGKA